MLKFLNSGKGQAQFIEYTDMSSGLNFTSGRIFFRMDTKPGEKVRDHMEAVHTRLSSTLQGTAFTLFPVSMESGKEGSPSFVIEFRGATVLPISTMLDALARAELAEADDQKWIVFNQTAATKKPLER